MKQSNNRFMDKTLEQTLQGLKLLESQFENMVQRQLTENSFSLEHEIFTHKQRIDALRRCICSEVEAYLRKGGKSA